MTAASRLIGMGFGHERNTHAELVGEFFHALFHHDMAVGHRQDFRVTHVELVLADGGFALGVLDRDL